MPYAVEMYFDAASEAKFRLLWESLAGLGAPGMRDSGARPHVSLGVADLVDVPRIVGLLDDFARHERAFALQLSSVGLFPTHAAVMYLAPKVTTELLALQARFYDEFAPFAQGFWKYYTPTEWVPHLTLAAGLSPTQLAPAFAACRVFGLPMTCQVSAIGLIEFAPVKRRHTVRFQASSG